MLLASTGDAAAGLLAGAFGLVIMVVLGLVGLALYFLPSVISVVRGNEHTLGIVVLNFFLGWTFLGWVGALVWSVADSRRRRA